MSSNNPDTANNDNQNDEKKDGACEINNKLVVHGTPRRKIIKAKRPPMSTPTPRTSASNADTIPVISPPADAGVDIKSGENHQIEAELDTPPLETPQENMDLDALIKHLDPAQLRLLVSEGVNDPQVEEMFSGMQGALDNLQNMDADRLKRKLMLTKQYNEHNEYVYMGNFAKVPANVVTVRFDSSVPFVFNNTFLSRNNMKKVVMNEGLNRINRKAFGNCSLVEVNMPSTLKQIDESAFSSCYQLKKVELNEGLLRVKEWCFGGCISLERITFPSTLKRIYGHTFNGCINLQEVSFGERLESIGVSAFAGCRLLKQVVFNDGLKKIGKDSFWNCSNLDEVIVMNEKNIQSIHCNAFRGCSLLQKIKLQSLSSRLSKLGMHK